LSLHQDVLKEQETISKANSIVGDQKFIEEQKKVTQFIGSLKRGVKGTTEV
jgi:hypothetical protein